MKMTKSNGAALQPQEENKRIKSMILNFRKHTLSLDDHRELTTWIEESEHNQHLFETWVLQGLPRTGSKPDATDSPLVMKVGGAHLFSRRSLPGMIAAIIFFVVVYLIYLLFR